MLMRWLRLTATLVLVASALASGAALVAFASAASLPAAGRPAVREDAADVVEAAFQKFWAARSPADAARVVDDVLKSGVTFDEAYRRLKHGRTYAVQKIGVVKSSNRTADRVEHYYSINVPASYDPARPMRVRFQLHGGVGGRTDNQPRGTGEIGNLAGDTDQIYVLPYAWSSEPWWSEDQVLNLAAIVDSLKRTYNIDENRVAVSGVSDGGTGAYYLAMRDTTWYASFLPLNGFIMVLANSEIDDGRLYINNLRNKPMFVVNGGRDRLYPTAITEPFVLHMKSSGVDIAYHPQPEAGHNTAWWPDLKETFEKFVLDHPRSPHPATLTWETADLAHNRAHWLVVDTLGARPSDARNLSDVNLVRDPEEIARFNVGGPITIFERRKPSGRVDLMREGNTVTAATRGVTSFTLLLSPDVFDFNQPIKVVVNGTVAHDARVERSLPVLLRWAARDNDRTMLYGAELKIRVP